VTFFDYPGTETETASAAAAEVFLPDASEADWAVLLRFTKRRKFATGEEVMSPGSQEQSLFLIVDGTLEVLATKGAPGITIESGSVLGEIAFFGGGGRSALVRATSSVEVAELGRAEFDGLARESPELARQILFDLGRILAHRLRTAQSPG
jgi:CRP/FNR family transcriptional regulator, cyclic AMP receptor protein